MTDFCREILAACSEGHTLVVGPSGVGKAFFGSYARERGRRVVDLGVLGYRLEDRNWKWSVIPPGALGVLNDGPAVIAIGASSNIDDLLSAAINHGWKIVFLVSSPMAIRANRILRGDSAEEQASSMDDYVSWKVRAQKYAACFDNVTVLA